MVDAEPTLNSVVSRMLRTAAAGVVDTEAAALTDEPDGVHQHRTRVRRLRSVLALVRDQVDSVAARRLRVEFREWGRQLGTVRDAEVAAIDADTAMTAAGIDDEAMRRRIVDAPTLEYSSLHARLVRLREQGRGEARMRELHTLVAAPVTAEGDAADVLAGLLAREVHRVKRAATHTDESPDQFHELRKAGRRLRYAAEAVAEAGPASLVDASTALGKAGKHLHNLLGEYRDAVALADRLERTQGRAGRAGEATEGYDRMIADASENARERLGAVDEAVDRVRSAASDLD